LIRPEPEIPQVIGRVILRKGAGNAFPFGDGKAKNLLFPFHGFGLAALSEIR
jgi:hypothetical protein